MLILTHSHFLKGSLEGQQTYLIKHKDVKQHPSPTQAAYFKTTHCTSLVLFEVPEACGEKKVTYPALCFSVTPDWPPACCTNKLSIYHHPLKEGGPT